MLIWSPRVAGVMAGQCELLTAVGLNPLPLTLPASYSVDRTPSPSTIGRAPLEEEELLNAAEAQLLAEAEGGPPPEKPVARYNGRVRRLLRHYDEALGAQEVPELKS
ncbi:hypothetical protein V499_00889 [Pseudogymnoascus sp. VKM F-103]|nr:hypothetical protein V499_00889 [Pseudogymnoascus sp. VKM F-103]